jgi:hypothetical protein
MFPSQKGVFMISHIVTKCQQEPVGGWIVCPRCQWQWQPPQPFDQRLSAALDYIEMLKVVLADFQQLLEEGVPL